MDLIETIKAWWPVLATVVNFVAVWIAWSFRKATVSPEELTKFLGGISSSIDKLSLDMKAHQGETDKRLADHDKRLIRVETELGNLPRHKDFDDIHTRMGGMSRSLSEVKGAVSSMAQQSMLIYQHLLSQSKGDK